MQYDVGKFVRDVRVTIDRNRKNHDLLDMDINTQMLDEAIVRNIVDGVRMVLLACPFRMLDEGTPWDAESTKEWMDGGSGRVRLPDDFLRLVSFKMSDWSYPLRELEEDTSAGYTMMKSPVKALRGVAERPRIFCVNTPDGKFLEFYSCVDENGEVGMSTYVPLPLIRTVATDTRDDADVIDIPLLCYGACVAQVGALVMLERGATELSQALQQEATSLIS